VQRVAAQRAAGVTLQDSVCLAGWEPPASTTAVDRDPAAESMDRTRHVKQRQKHT
jgi:hypothetical protein